MALSILLSRHLNVQCNHYDPLFNISDKEIISHFNAIPLSSSYPINGDTKFPILYYMIHCNISLYSNILNIHWNELNSIIIIGNTLTAYDTTLITSKDRKEKINCVLLLSKYIISKQLPIGDDDSCLYSAFNDTSINTFNSELIELDKQNGIFPIKPNDLWIDDETK